VPPNNSGGVVSEAHVEFGAQIGHKDDLNGAQLASMSLCPFARYLRSP
jgi:hypothetical protein